ncbi:MAG: YceD family protein, partial [Turicibacter sp.]
MKWAIAQLIKKGSEIFEIDETVDFEDIVKRHDEIRSMSKVRVTGTGQLQQGKKKIVFVLHIEGTMTLPCALTLDDVVYPFDSDSVEIFVLDKDIYEEDEDEYLVTGTTVELAPVVWQNILLQKPLRIVKDGAYDEIKKRGIEIESEEEFAQAAMAEQANKIDPRLAILS